MRDEWSVFQFRTLDVDVATFSKNSLQPGKKQQNWGRNTRSLECRDWTDK